jgi:hypothetical protein
MSDNTLTVDPTPPAEIVGEVEGVQLTADEQDSLEVGEQLSEAQDQLLAGKYKDAQELEKAYVELQNKLGEDGQEEDNTEAEQEEVLQEESEEGSKDYSEGAQLISSASDEFNENGELSAETLAEFSQMSSQDLVNAYLEITKDSPQNLVQSQADISDRDINQIQNSVGGEGAYDNLIGWASDNLSEAAVEAFDAAVNTGSPHTIQLMVNGLKAQYDEANGYEGRTLSGKPPRGSTDTFRSQPELIAAMSDPRYENDPAYRQDIIEKLDRSDLQF